MESLHLHSLKCQIMSCRWKSSIYLCVFFVVSFQTDCTTFHVEGVSHSKVEQLLKFSTYSPFFAPHQKPENSKLMMLRPPTFQGACRSLVSCMTSTRVLIIGSISRLPAYHSQITCWLAVKC